MRNAAFFLLVGLLATTALAIDPATVDRIAAEADGLYPSLVEARRWFHALSLIHI